MEEAFINQISGEQHSARYKKDLPILPNNCMVWFPWFTKYTDQNSFACEAQHLLPYRVTQDHLKDSKSPLLEKSCNTSTYRRALEPVLRARSTGFALEPALKLGASTALTTAFRAHKGPGNKLCSRVAPPDFFTDSRKKNLNLPPPSPLPLLLN